MTPDDYPRPDTFYGWAKVAYESLGFLYACGSLGQRLEVVQIRIVAPREIDASEFEDRPLRGYLRDITGYISQRDLQQLFVGRWTPMIDDPYGVPFQIFYGVSNNARTFWSITNAREVIGYAPAGRLGDPLCGRHRPDDRPRLRAALSWGWLRSRTQERPGLASGGCRYARRILSIDFPGELIDQFVQIADLLHQGILDGFHAYSTHRAGDQ